MNGEEIDYFPYDITDEVEPIYVELPGWQTDMTKMQSEDEFPEEFNAYLSFLEEQLGVQIKIVVLTANKLSLDIQKNKKASPFSLFCGEGKADFIKSIDLK